MIDSQVPYQPGNKLVFRSTDSDAGGQAVDVVIVRELTDAECDIADVGYMYVVQMENGETAHAFHDELKKL